MKLKHGDKLICIKKEKTFFDHLFTKDVEKDFQYSLWGTFLVAPSVSLKRMMCKDFEVSFWGMPLIPRLLFLKGMLWEDFEVSLWGLFGYRVGLFENDVVEGF